MGTTLTNGVYLPNEGERNCYAGLKTNWEILDQKVADVTALQQAVAGALHREIVESLPTTDIDPNTIYMVLSGTSATENVYNEFMYVNNAWELIGTSATDLTNYYTKAEVDGKLLLKANASDLTSHTGDTTIHVTASDKAKWNNQTYVLRYSSTTLTASSTNSNSLLDNTDNLKVGDKVIDSSGVIYSVTDIDTANSTFTIGTALIDLAQDSDVVHKSGNETISGTKTFSSDINVYNSDNTADTANIILRNSKAERGSTTNIGEQNISFVDKNNNQLGNIKCITNSSGVSNMYITCNASGSDRGVRVSRTPSITYFRSIADNDCKLGTTDIRWSDVQTYQINGVEPSSLSLPSGRSARVDISSYFTDTSTGGINRYTAPANGYIYLNVTDVVTMHILAQTSNNLTHYADTRGRNSVGQLNALLPVRNNDVFSCQWYTTATNVTLNNAFFIPCQGNV